MCLGAFEILGNTVPVLVKYPQPEIRNRMFLVHMNCLDRQAGTFLIRLALVVLECSVHEDLNWHKVHERRFQMQLPTIYP